MVSKRQRTKAFAAAQFVALHGPNPLVTFPVAYDVPLNLAALSWIAYSGTVSRLAVKFDVGSAGLGGRPEIITLNYRTYGKPTGVIRVGIRKVVDDSFQLISEWPIEFAGGFEPIKTVEIRGGNNYQMLANDKVSIEYPASSTDGLEVAVNTGQANPSGYTSQSYTGTYGNTANPLALKIVSRVVT